MTAFAFDRDPRPEPPHPRRETIAAPLDAGEDDGPIEPRGWILGTSYCRRFVSAKTAKGGLGKTALMILEALSIVTGRPLTNEHVFRRGRVLLITLEDDLDELRRRVRAACIYYRIDPADIRGRLFIAAPIGWKAAVVNEAGEVREGPLCDFIRTQTDLLAIDLVMLDPFVKTHTVEENRNDMIDKVAIIFTGLAISLDIGIGIAHHVSKGADDPGNADRARGASAFRDAARLVHTLTEMSPEEAQTLGIPDDERRSLIRVDSGKLNIAPKSGKAKWFKLVSVGIGNATADYPRGDFIGVIEPWEPPDFWAHLSSIVANRILDLIDAGMEGGTRYSGNRSARQRAAWRVVKAEVDVLTESQCRSIIATWLKAGVIEETEYLNPARREKELGLVVIPGKRPT